MDDMEAIKKQQCADSFDWMDKEKPLMLSHIGKYWHTFFIMPIFLSFLSINYK
jgi:hypothetical protein